MEDLKLDDLEEIQLIHYDLLKELKSVENNLIEYIVLPDDSVEGIALKFNINPKKILEINSFSE